MRRAGAAILVSAMLALCGAPALAQTQVALPKIEGSYLVVQSDASIEVPADTVTIALWVEGTAESLPDAKSAHLTSAGAVGEALKALGLRIDQIESSEYSSRQKTKWDPETQTEIFIANQVTSRLEVTTTDFELVPRIVEAALGAGASGVSGFEFDSSKRSEARTQAIEKATEEARRDAQALAKASDVSLAKLNGVYLDPWAFQWELGIPQGIQSGGGGGGQSIFRDKAAAEALVFQPEPVTVSATVRLVYETKPITQ